MNKKCPSCKRIVDEKILFWGNYNTTPHVCEDCNKQTFANLIIDNFKLVLKK